MFSAQPLPVFFALSMTSGNRSQPGGVLYHAIRCEFGLGIGSNSLLVTESRAMMNFNALEAILRQRLSHGLEYTLNYTYSKSMTNSLG